MTMPVPLTMLAVGSSEDDKLPLSGSTVAVAVAETEKLTSGAMVLMLRGKGRLLEV